MFELFCAVEIKGYICLNRSIQNDESHKPRKQELHPQQVHI